MIILLLFKLLWEGAEAESDNGFYCQQICRLDFLKTFDQQIRMWFRKLDKFEMEFPFALLP